VSDIRAIVVGRGIEVGDGPYHERADPAFSGAEEWLRAALARLPAWRRGDGREFLRLAEAHEARLRDLDDSALRSALGRAVAGLRKSGFADAPVAEAFAVVREASRRVLGMRHHDVQLLASRALLKGCIAEMATGEGKTLAATLAVCTAAAGGATVHVVTVNDYLAERDAEANAPLYRFFGLGVETVLEGMSIEERRGRYAADVVYVSNKELTFDYLKDRLTLRGTLRAHEKLRRLHSPSAAASSVLRGLHVAIVDEADSVLVDEARTPLIISETLPDELGPGVYDQAIGFARSLRADSDYALTKDRDVWLTQDGFGRVAELSGALGGIWQSTLWQRELVQKALSALHLFQRDQHYIVVDGKVQIVDEFTGRVMPDRTWERGLHQMIEAKEGAEITGQRRTLAQITYQRFFGKYLLLAGMTGTAKEIEPELKRVYDLSAVRIPTHRPCRRKRLPDRVFDTSAQRWDEVARRAGEIAGKGRAVLVGTRSVEASETLGRLLEARGTPHAVLNARQDKSEADTVALAGKAGRITVATNMAGRGTDIKLDPDVEATGGLHVILTEFHESARIDRQLFGRSARQGDPGSVEAIVCLEDELFARHARWAARAYGRLPPAFGRLRPALFRVLVRYAQWKAESGNRRVRLETIKQDRKWLQALGFVGGARK
jgi:preprotein translocase subunit SecA